MKAKYLLIFFLLFFFNYTLAKSCNDYDLQMDADRCWLGKVNAIEKEMDNKYEWILYWNMNAIYFEGDLPSQAVIDDFKKYSIPVNSDIQRAHDLFLQYRMKTCHATYIASIGGEDRYQTKYMCLYGLTKSYIADLEDQFFPQGWQPYYQEYLKKKNSIIKTQ